MSDRALLRLLVLAATLAVFAPCLSAGFVGWDDKLFVLDNPAIRGLDAAHLCGMADSFLGSVWIPLTWLSYALDFAAWGMEPVGYHLTNLLLHAASAILFYEVYLLLLEPKLKTNAPIAAALSALFFAIHPLRVESVAWISERKGVLAGALWLAALYGHLREKRAAALAAFALSLAAKPNGVTFPFVILLLDAAWLRKRPSIRTFAPYFALSAAALAVTIYAGKAPGAFAHIHAPGAAWGAGQSLYSLLFYLEKTALPLGLAAYYPPRPWFGHWSWPLAACASAVAAIAAAAFALRGRSRPAAVAVAAYAIILLPTLGLVQHGLLYSVADRYSYLSCLGFAVLFGTVFGREGALPRLLAVTLLASLGTATWRQCEIWRDSLSLWTATVQRAPSSLAEGELGAALIEAGRAKEGVERLSRAVEAGGLQAGAYVNLGAAFQRLGREQEARAAWRRGLADAPVPELKALLGASLADDAGLALIREALAARPKAASWRVDLGDALARAGDVRSATSAYETALIDRPGYGRAHNNLGLLLERADKRDEALAHYRAALYDATTRAEANHNIGNQLLAAGRTDDAERRFREAVRLEPGLVASRVNLGNLLARRGRLAAAAEQYRAALKKDRASPEARSNLNAVENALRR